LIQVLVRSNHLQIFDMRGVLVVAKKCSGYQSAKN
jgi:hypothetical protein